MDIQDDPHKFFINHFDFRLYIPYVCTLFPILQQSSYRGMITFPAIIFNNVFNKCILHAYHKVHSHIIQIFYSSSSHVTLAFMRHLSYWFHYQCNCFCEKMLWYAYLIFEAGDEWRLFKKELFI